MEQRVGKRTSKIEVKGTQLLGDGTEVHVTWQVQTNSEFGLPTEQDLDIFVAIGVLTFRNHFAKTVTFQGREIASLLNIASVHGRFYKRLKLAMDRFIGLRFRAITQSERSDEVKWLNVFQEASFSLDQHTGRCTGSITWTDKIIQAMDRGFFRVLDANRYMMLDGLTTKYLYRYLVVAFEATPIAVVDARQLAIQHLGIVSLPKYFSRLLQTLEPALEQLRREEVVGSWHIVSKADWKIAIRCHERYVPERRMLLAHGHSADLESRRAESRAALEELGIATEPMAEELRDLSSLSALEVVERARHLLDRMVAEDVVLPVAQQLVRNALKMGFESLECRDLLDWIEIALCVRDQKRRSGSAMRNGAGLIVKLARDGESQNLIGADMAKSWKDGFRRREAAAERSHEEARERCLLIEYEEYAEAENHRLWMDQSEESRQQWKQRKYQQYRNQERFKHLPDFEKQQELENAARRDLAAIHIPPFEKWCLRRLARQATLPLIDGSGADLPAAGA